MQESGGGGGVGGELLAEGGEAGEQESAFLGFGGAMQDEVVEVIDAGGVFFRGEQDALGEGARSFDVGDVVQGGEGVQGGVGAFGFDLADLARGVVEEVGGADDATPEGVEGAAVEGFALILNVAFFAEGGFLPDAVGLVGLHGGAALEGAEQAGGGEGDIAQHPGGQAMAGAAGEEAIFGVDLDEGGGDFGALAVGAAGDDETEEVLDVPAAVHEFDGEPVEQFGVAGFLALQAEVLDAFDEAGAEEGLPVAVDGDAGGQRVVAGDEPVGEVEAIGALAGWRSAGEGDGHGTDDLDGGGFVVGAFVEDEGVPWLLDLVHDHDAGDAVLGGVAVAHGVQMLFQNSDVVWVMAVGFEVADGFEDGVHAAAGGRGFGEGGGEVAGKLGGGGLIEAGARGAGKFFQLEGFDGLDGAVEFLGGLGDALLIGGGGEVEGRGAFAVATGAGFGHLVEDVVEGEVVALGEGVVLVVVAAAAVEGGGEPEGAGGFDAVEDVFDAGFLGDAAALAVVHVVAVEAGGELLVEGGVGEEVASDLFEGELVVRLVGVEGVHDPVAPGPHGAFGVALVAVGVGVAGGVEPVPGPAFAVARTGEEEVHVGVKLAGGGGSGKGVGAGGKAGEVEGEATGEGGR